jgi:hypothetical protein
MTDITSPAARDERSTWPAAFAGALLFIVIGLADTTLYLRSEQAQKIYEHWHWLIFWGPFLLVPPIGFAIGWIRNFPRWSYPYLVLAGLTALYMINVATPGLRVFGYTFARNDLWGPRAFVPLILAVALAAAVSHSLAPWRTFFLQLRDDWTLGSFALFGIMPMILTVSFDETGEYAVPFMLALTCVMALVAVIYLRTANRAARAAVLLTGSSSIVLISMIAAAYYDWSYRGTVVTVAGIAIATAVIVGFIFLPAGILVAARWLARIAPTRPAAMPR